MESFTYIGLLISAFAFVPGAFAPVAMAAENFRSDYVGQQQRVIKSLSAHDITQLQTGKGWGLAKAAELNGVPGPSHLLQMEQQLDLTEQQKFAIKSLFEKMKSEAIPLGKELISAERVLNETFASGNINEKSLQSYLQKIAAITQQLRFVHLRAHLATRGLLSSEQIKKYNKLRGYGDKDPCSQTPAGHDKQMWKQHNGCS